MAVHLIKRKQYKQRKKLKAKVTSEPGEKVQQLRVYTAFAEDPSFAPGMCYQATPNCL